MEGYSSLRVKVEIGGETSSSVYHQYVILYSQGGRPQYVAPKTPANTRKVGSSAEKRGISGVWIERPVHCVWLTLCLVPQATKDFFTARGFCH